jgi:hypothetical protein
MLLARRSKTRPRAIAPKSRLGVRPLMKLFLLNRAAPLCLLVQQKSCSRLLLLPPLLPLVTYYDDLVILENFAPLVLDDYVEFSEVARAHLVELLGKD